MSTAKKSHVIRTTVGGQRPAAPLPDNAVEPLLYEREAAKLLAISPRKLWGLAAAGAIPFIQIGPRSKRYDRRDILEFVERSRQASAAQNKQV